MQPLKSTHTHTHTHTDTHTHIHTHTNIFSLATKMSNSFIHNNNANITEHQAEQTHSHLCGTLSLWYQRISSLPAGYRCAWCCFLETPHCHSHWLDQRLIIKIMTKLSIQLKNPNSCFHFCKSISLSLGCRKWLSFQRDEEALMHIAVEQHRLSLTLLYQ